MSKFVKTEVKTTILKTVDGVGPEASYVSIVPTPFYNCVEVVIGARYEDRRLACLNKIGVSELISILKEVHDAME